MQNRPKYISEIPLGEYEQAGNPFTISCHWACKNRPPTTEDAIREDIYRENALKDYIGLLECRESMIGAGDKNIGPDTLQESLVKQADAVFVGPGTARITHEQEGYVEMYAMFYFPAVAYRKV